MKKLALNLCSLFLLLSPSFLYANNDELPKLDPNEAYTVTLHVETATGDHILSTVNLENYQNAILFNEAGDFVPMMDQLASLSEGINLDAYQGNEINRYYFSVIKTNISKDDLVSLDELERMMDYGSNDFQQATKVCYGKIIVGWYAWDRCTRGPLSNYCIAARIATGQSFIIPCQSGNN